MFAMTAETINNGMKSFFTPIQAINGLAIEYVEGVAGSQLESIASVSHIALNQITAMTLVKQPEDIADLGTHSFKTSVAYHQVMFNSTQRMLKVNRALQGSINQLVFKVPRVGLLEKLQANDNDLGATTTSQSRVVGKAVKVANVNTAKKTRTVKVLKKSPVHLVGADTNETIDDEKLAKETSAKETSDSATTPQGRTTHTQTKSSETATKFDASSPGKDTMSGRNTGSDKKAASAESKAKNKKVTPKKPEFTD